MSLYSFGPFQMDSDRRLLFKVGEHLPLTSRAFELLLYFIEHPGRIIGRDELLRACWPDTVVQESNLTNQIFTIRQVLGERPQEHRFIVTIPEQGYRFVGDVCELPRQKPTAISDRSIEPASNGVVRSIAVLPFQTHGKPEWRDEYLEHGLADALIIRLSRIRHVIVRSTIAISVNDLGKTPLASARKLRVDAVLAGSIQRMDENFRVTVQLLRVRDGAILCAHQFDEKFSDLFKVEDSVAEQTAAALRTTLSMEEQHQIARRPTTSSEAYDAYLKGRYFWNKRTEEALRIATECFEQAIRHDPNYAVAYTGMADCYNLLAFLGNIPPRDGSAKANQAALKALELDPALAEAHASMAFANLCQWAWEDSFRSFHRAVEAAPNYATTYHWFSEYFTALGRFDDAIAMTNRARELDPMSLTINANLGSILYYARQYDRAIDELKRTLELDRYFLLTHWYLALNYEQKDMYSEAIEELERALGVSQGSPLILATLGHVLGISKKKSQARKVIGELKALSLRRYVSPYNFAIAHAGLGENSETLYWLQQAYKERSNWLAYLNVDPRLDNLRSDRSFEGLVKKVALPR